MDDIITFITTNWLPILIMIACLIHDPKAALMIGIGFMLFGTNNTVFLWCIFILSILSLGSKTYTHVKETNAIKDKSKWEM